MSYDVTLTCGTCGSTYDRNMTSNVARMWRDAGIDLRERCGQPVVTLLPDLQTAIDTMANDPGRFEAMEPENGWGSYVGALDFLRDLRDAACRNPDAIYEVSC